MSATRDVFLPVAAQPRLDDFVDLIELAEGRGYERAWLPETWGRDAVTILATAAEIGSRYEWHQHVTIARDVGIDDSVIAAIGAGAGAGGGVSVGAAGDSDGLDADERILISYVRAVVRGEVDAIAHAAIAAAYDEAAIVGIAALAQGYVALGGLIRAFDLELEPGRAFHGWDPR